MMEPYGVSRKKGPRYRPLAYILYSYIPSGPQHAPMRTSHMATSIMWFISCVNPDGSLVGILRNTSMSQNRNYKAPILIRTITWDMPSPKPYKQLQNLSCHSPFHTLLNFILHSLTPSPKPQSVHPKTRSNPEPYSLYPNHTLTPQPKTLNPKP